MRLVVPALAVLLALTACGEQPGATPSPAPTPSPTPSPTPTRTPEEALANRCASPEGQYGIGFPEEWRVNDPEAGDPCSWFHFEAFELPTATEPTELAIHVDVEDSPFEQLTEGATTGPHVKEVLAREGIRLAGKEALRVEILNSGQGLYPEDTRETTYFVRWDGETLVASTTSAAEGSYADNVDVLVRMMRTLARREAGAACSAAALDAALEEQEGLPEPVAAMRRDIVRAAVACDFERLGELAQRGEGTFTYSFGDSGNPSEFWRRQEAEGQQDKPLRYLVGVLRRPFGTRQVQGQIHYVWPAAFAYDSWESVPEDQKEALKPLYDELSLRRFAEFGGYIGYRVGIDESGNWLHFVAGD